MWPRLCAEFTRVVVLQGIGGIVLKHRKQRVTTNRVRKHMLDKAAARKSNVVAIRLRSKPEALNSSQFIDLVGEIEAQQTALADATVDVQAMLREGSQQKPLAFPKWFCIQE